MVLKNGRISEIGTFQELLGHKAAFAEFVLTYLNDPDTNDDIDPDCKCDCSSSALRLERSFCFCHKCMHENEKVYLHIKGGILTSVPRRDINDRVLSSVFINFKSLSFAVSNFKIIEQSQNVSY